MDLVSALAPPRLRRLAGVDVWVRPLGLGDFAMVLAWLDDVLPGRPDRKLAPKLWDDESRKAAESFPGRCVLAYAVLRHEGMPYADVRELVSNADPIEWEAFLDAAFAHRKTLADDGVAGKDLAETWFGPSLHALCERFAGYTLESAARLTLDQYALLAGEGKPDEDPSRVEEAKVAEMTHVSRMLHAGEDLTGYVPTYLSREYVAAMHERWLGMKGERGEESRGA